MPHALVRPPGPRLSQGLVTHQQRVPLDVELAREQWHGYVDALRAAEWTVAEVEPADDCPDAVFIEDALVVVDGVAVVTRPGAPTRLGEIAGAERAAADCGLELHHIEAPATLDGGDVLTIGRTVYVGVGGRTSEDGLAQLARLLTPRGWFVRPVTVRAALHLKSVVTALPDGTAIGVPDQIDDIAVFDRFVAAPEPSGAHVVVLDESRILMAAGAPESERRYRSMGLEPVIVDISEFEKLEGCVTCLSVRVRSSRPPPIPMI